MAAAPPTYPRWALYLAQGQKIPYKRHWVRCTHPLALADKIRRPPQYSQEPECLTEMSLMMACWKQNEFSDIACAEEIQTFLRCSSESEARRKEKMKREAMGQTGHFNLQEVNQILKEFPNIKKFS
uniref:Small ribosomal subunit protein mS37 n=1 Tax=Pogona vitticeps TaxID=103695 RepID=A0A6J0TIF8_9SAUR